MQPGPVQDELLHSHPILSTEGSHGYADPGPENTGQQPRRESENQNSCKEDMNGKGTLGY